MKRKIIIISCVLAVTLLGAAGRLLYLHFQPSPLDAYDFTDCTVSVYGYYSQDIIRNLTEEETAEFVSRLQAARIFPLADARVEGFIGGQKNETAFIFKTATRQRSVREQTICCGTENGTDAMKKPCCI